VKTQQEERVGHGMDYEVYRSTHSPAGLRQRSLAGVWGRLYSNIFPRFLSFPLIVWSLAAPIPAKGNCGGMEPPSSTWRATHTHGALYSRGEGSALLKSRLGVWPWAPSSSCCSGRVTLGTPWRLDYRSGLFFPHPNPVNHSLLVSIRSE